MSPVRFIPAVALSLWAAVALAAPPPPGVTATVHPDRVRLGEPFHYRIAVTRPSEERFDLERPGDRDAFGVLGFSRTRQEGATNATTTFDVTMAVYDLGPRQLPEVVLDAVQAGAHHRLPVNGPSITGVSSLTKKGEKLLDILGPGGTEIRSLRLLALGAGLLIFATLTFVLVRWRLRRALPLDRRTRAALDALAAAGLPEHDRTQDFYFQLDDIVRRHLGERHRFETLECTTSELVAWLGALPAPELPKEELSGFLRQADLVKFARAPRDLAACHDALDFGYRLVEVAPTPPPRGGADAHATVS